LKERINAKLELKKTLKAKKDSLKKIERPVENRNKIYSERTHDVSNFHQKKLSENMSNFITKTITPSTTRQKASKKIDVTVELPELVIFYIKIW